MWGHAPERAETDDRALVAFVCGLVGLFVAGLILGPFAIVLARSAELRIQYSEGTLKGEGLVKAARVMGWISLVSCLAVLWILYGDRLS
jgi:flagellar motor component MotA